MEDTLEDHIPSTFQLKVLCLNPCFYGRYSGSGTTLRAVKAEDGVLILVFMEDTLEDCLLPLYKD